MKQFIRQHLWWLTCTVALLLLVAHTLRLATLTVDSTSILLLAVILASPFVAAIKKIKFGEFEAEIDPAEVKKLKDETEAALSLQENVQERVPEIRRTAQAIRELAGSDTVLALAKLRIELEKVLRRFSVSVPDRPTPEKQEPLGLVVQRLAQQEIIARDLAKPLREVLGICNRALHGEDIRDADARAVIEVGAGLLETIYWDSKDLLDGVVLSERVISPAEAESYYKKRYRLTTIIPLVGGPKRVVREVTQEQLEEYLEGYYEFAEFVVDLREAGD